MMEDIVALARNIVFEPKAPHVLFVAQKSDSILLKKVEIFAIIIVNFYCMEMCRNESQSSKNKVVKTDGIIAARDR